ncbi:retroviral-like aspartic protease family protein [Kozakia baliensis]|uniref:retroviral-like aspartic protease family protein n=1 Tax=Kozakia baliensis TaxID=153496 RepID=UPI000B221CE0|nr:retroviral-like aspartic protease family protein [Kozakia baliensis]
MMRRFFLLLALGISTAHAAPQTGICRLEVAAQAPLRNDALFLSIPVRLDGREARVIVDTGSEGSLITPEGAARLRLRPDPAHATFLHGANGRGQLAPNLLVSSLRIGGKDLGGHSIPLGALPSLPDVSPPIIGLIGADVLSGYDLEIDVPHRKLTLWTVKLGSEACRRPPPWHSGYATLNARAEGGRLSVAFRLDGQNGWALVDSGARSHILSRNFAHRVGVSDAMLARDPGGITSGVDLNARWYHWHRFNRLELGTEAVDAANPVWVKPVLTVSDVRDGVDMLLGADWFARHDVWVSYATSQVFAMPEMRAPGK